MVITRQLAFVVCVSVGTLLAAPSHLWAACLSPVARIVSIDNSVQLREASGAAAYVAAVLNAPVCQGDSIRVGDFSRATIAFLDSGLRLTIEQNTEFTLQPPRRAGRSFIDLVRGAILFMTRQPRSLDVRTPFVNAAVEGTEFLIRVDDDRAEVAVLDGTVALTNEQGSLVLTTGESGQVLAGQAPRRIDVRPQDAVHWALYYQPLLPPATLATLDQVATADRDASYFVRRAGALLGIGRADEARADLARATQRAPDSSDALALAAVIDVAQNQRDSALTNARRAVSLAPQSATARLALSYALQAGFELEAARDQLLAVVPSSAGSARPEDAPVLARLAELWLSLGYLDKALDAARRAALAAPDLSRAQIVLGFAELTQIKTAEAKTSFERAIGLESSNPLAHFGLALAKIRQGDLLGGRHDLETAAALDADDAVIRSYLGKAYFEEKRDRLSAEQFGLAKERDPLDPTPYLYDAIRKQAVNQPVAALQDLQQSIALNDNRAVYRSRFLLDTDLAARGASLGRIYRDLGFEQLALVEGWRSLAADAGDYSAHRLLADDYSALPRHEVARVSELLQAQLLQPLSLTPVGPRLADTNLFILPGAGPSEPAFNEFNSLFARNRLAVQFSGAAGQHSVLGDELTVSGVWNRLSFSVGQFHYDTDGFRENNDQDRNIYNAFVQGRLSASTSIQAEVRAGDAATGDLNLLFNPDDFSADERTRTRSRLGRIGLRHVFSPRSQLIASVYGAHDERETGSGVQQLSGSGSILSTSSTDSGTAEARHLFRAERWSLTSGAGVFSSTRRRNEQLNLELPVPPFVLTFDDQFNDDPRQTNLYSYASMDLARVAVTVGGSADFYDSRLLNRHQFNPKLGVIWNPAPATTVRAAAFRTFQRTLVASQTIEPTQVAGFNQFFADSEGEQAWRYGVAVDRKFSRRWFAGVEYSWRDLTVPVEIVSDSGDTVVTPFARSEQLGRSYAYWSQGHIAAQAEYVFERFDRNAGSSGIENIIELRTHRVPFGIRYFNPAGWSASGQASYIRQRGEFASLASAPTGEDQFWLVDASLGYRLPRRYGRFAFEVKNLFDKRFQFQDTDPGNPLVRPRRLALLTFTIGI